MTHQRITPLLGLCVLVAMLLAILGVAISEIHSFDVFWQLQNGRYMAETHQLIYTDLFTLAKDAPRYEHTWLHSLILFGLYKVAGYDAISIFKGVMIALTGGVLVLAARRRASSWTAITLVLPLFLLTGGGWLERPQLWTFLGTAIFIFWLEKHSRKPSWHLLCLLPVVLVWSNVHAGSILALALAFAYLVGETGQSVLERRFSWKASAWLVGLFGGVFLVGLVNPYPERWLNTLLGSYRLGASIDSSGKLTGSKTAVFNMDWTPTTFQNEPLFFYTIGVVAVILLLGCKRLRLTDLCLLAGLALMGNKLVRHVPFFYIGVIAILPAYLDQIGDTLRRFLPSFVSRLAPLFLCVFAIVFFGYYYAPMYRVYGLLNTGLRAWHYPIEATEFVKENKLQKNIYNTYDWGGYMAFKLYPDYLMFWDGRQNSAEMFSLGWNVMAGKPGWKSTLDEFDVKTIVTRASTIDTGQKYPLLDRLRSSNDWSLVLNTESSMVFVRNDSVSQDWLKRYVLTKDKIDDTVLSEAHLMVKYNPNRYMAWWEMAQIYNKRKQYKNALFALNQHLARAPRPHPSAMHLRSQLQMFLKGRN